MKAAFGFSSNICRDDSEHAISLGTSSDVLFILRCRNISGT